MTISSFVCSLLAVIWNRGGLHNQSCPEALCTEFTQAQAKTHIRREGKDVTLISNSYMTLEAIHAANHLAEMGIDAEILDLTQLTETDWPLLYNSVNKTGHCVIADIGHKSFGIGAEISARLMENCFSALKAAPVRLGLPDYPEPTSFGLTKDYYNDANSIAQAVAALFGKTAKAVKQKTTPHDVPGDWFTGPF